MLAELDGAVLHQKDRAFRVIPYFTRKKIELLKDIPDLIDVTKDGLRKIEETEKVDKELPDKDFSFEKVWLHAEQLDGENLEQEECLEEDADP